MKRGIYLALMKLASPLDDALVSTTFIAQYPIVVLFYLFVLMLCLAGVRWIDIPSSLFSF